jgi:hypothetical protein
MNTKRAKRSFEQAMNNDAVRALVRDCPVDEFVLVELGPPVTCARVPVAQMPPTSRAEFERKRQSTAARCMVILRDESAFTCALEPKSPS